MRLFKAFTLIELMVVILIVGILAAASTPLMRGRIESAKWTEGKATVGTIRSAVRTRFAETGTAGDLVGVLSDAGLRADLGFYESDLAGTYFVAGDYNITSVNADGLASITVTGSQSNAPTGSWTLDADGNWSSSSAGTGGGGAGSGSSGNDNGNGNGNNGNGNGNNGNNGNGNGNGNGRPKPVSPNK